MSTQQKENSLQVWRGTFQEQQNKIAEMLPSTIRKMITPERFTRTVLSSMTKNPALMNCTKDSVLRSMIESASLGLEPSGGSLGHAYLVPYGQQCTLIIGYRGLIDLARRSGSVKSVESHVVYARDKFKIVYGREPVLEHEPLIQGDRGDIVAAYVIAELPDGVKQTEVMTRQEIDDIKKRSKASSSGPWVTDFAEMCRKTVVRRAAKYWPLSAELVRAFDLDDEQFEVEKPVVVEIEEGKHSFGFKKKKETIEAEVVSELPEEEVKNMLNEMKEEK